MPSYRDLTLGLGLEEERSTERLRGAIQWPKTISERASTGLPHLFVTSPSRRAYQTPENELLVFSLDAIRTAGRRTRWHTSTARDAGRNIRYRVDASERWLRNRMLTEIERRPITAAKLARVRSGRSRRRYDAALRVATLYQKLLRRLDRDAIRQAIEERGLIAREDDVLLELLCGFTIERALRDLGWKTVLPGLVRSGRFIRASRESQSLEVFSQRAPVKLAENSVYGEVQQAHAFPGTGQLRPDYVLRSSSPSSIRWILIEIKGVDRPVGASAREALHDLLAYRRAFNSTLSQQPEPYGLGIAWGEHLDPASGSEIVLCTPDTVKGALSNLFGDKPG